MRALVGGAVVGRAGLKCQRGRLFCFVFLCFLFSYFHHQQTTSGLEGAWIFLGISWHILAFASASPKSKTATCLGICPDVPSHVATDGTLRSTRRSPLHNVTCLLGTYQRSTPYGARGHGNYSATTHTKRNFYRHWMRHVLWSWRKIEP